MSRPSSSVPSQCAADGGCSRSASTCWIGEWVARTGASAATTSRPSTIRRPITASGLRAKASHERYARPSRACTPEAGVSLSSHARQLAWRGGKAQLIPRPSSRPSASGPALLARQLVVDLEPGHPAARPHVQRRRDPLRVVEARERDAHVLVAIRNGADRGAAARTEAAPQVRRGAIVGGLAGGVGETREREVDPGGERRADAALAHAAVAGARAGPLPPRPV